MSGTPLRRRYRDSLTGRRRPHAVYRPTATSPLWRRYLAALFDVPRTPRPRPPAPPARAALSRLPMALILAAVAASLLLGGTTVAVLQAGTERDLGKPPFSSPALTPTEEPTEEPTHSAPGSPPPSHPGATGTPGGGELPSTGPSPLPLTALGLSLLAVGAVGAALTRRRRHCSTGVRRP
jgi:LPXTG-motif cell wall-anchored protein